MTGAEHYAKAETCLSASECQSSFGHAARELAEAQVHATLALAAAVEKAGDSAYAYGTHGYGR